MYVSKANEAAPVCQEMLENVRQHSKYIQASTAMNLVAFDQNFHSVYSTENDTAKSAQQLQPADETLSTGSCCMHTKACNAAELTVVH